MRLLSFGGLIRVLQQQPRKIKETVARVREDGPQVRLEVRDLVEVLFCVRCWLLHLYANELEPFLL